MTQEQSYKEKSKQTFDLQAKEYDSTYNGRHAGKLYGKVMEKLNEQTYSTVLDIGCGTGTILSMIPSSNNMKLSGIDLSDEMIHIARERLNKNVELIVGDSEYLPWEENCFDVLLCTDSFHHYPNPQNVLKEMGRVLKDKGRLIIADPWSMAPLRRLTNVFIRFGNDGDFKIYSKNEMSELLKLHGFNITGWELVNGHSFILTALINK